MKKQIISLFLGIFLFSQSQAANLNAGEKIKIKETQNEDCYIGAEDVEILAPIYGDLVVGGGEIKVADSVSQDVLAGGGKISIHAPIGDDIRVSGGQILIEHTVHGDLLAFGGEITLGKNGQILGDVICMGGELELLGDVVGDVLVYGGKVSLEGMIGGNVEVKCGELEFDGEVSGDMIIQSEEIELGETAECKGSIRYWTGHGEIDFSRVCQDVSYDEELAFGDEDIDESVIVGMLGLGIISYWIIVVLTVIVLLILFEYFFSKYFERAIKSVKSSFISCFGYGMLYLIGTPVLIVISLVLIIGIPIGLFALSVYSLSFLIATTAIGLAVSHHFRDRSKQEWSRFQVIAYATLTVIILKIVFLIPALGSLLKTIAMASVYGAFFKMAIENRKKKAAA